MAKSGTPSRVHEAGSPRSIETRRRLIDAAVATLQREGFARSSARVIAERAQMNQGLIFYHFGSVTNLLLAALDDVSAKRLERYGAMVDGVDTPDELVDAAAAIFDEDLDAGYVTVLVEMIGGASSTPGLGPAVAERIRPWISFTENSMRGVLGDSPLAGLIPASDLAHAVVALYIGLEMLSHLEGDRSGARRLATHAKDLSRLASALTGPATEAT